MIYSKLKLLFTYSSLIKAPFFSFLATSLLACSGTKQLPKPCIEEHQSAAQELCESFLSQNQSEIDRMMVLTEYGFNEKDIGEIFQRSKSQSSSCLAMIRRQCGLIELRNGVGY